MTETTTDISKQGAAKVAGFMFLFSLIVPSLNWAFVLSKFSIPGDVPATAKKILSGESLFRFGMTIELFMSVGLVVLAWVLYTILKDTGKKIALLALLLKLIEATIVAVIVLITFIALQIPDAGSLAKVFSPEQLQLPVGLILNSHFALFSIPMVFLGLDMMLFSYLFLRSGYIPRLLAGFGILAFALIFIHALLFILAPEIAVKPVAQIIFYLPSGIFELVIGIWLLAKGIETDRMAT